MKRFRKAPFTGLFVVLLLVTAACSKDDTVEIKEMIRLEQHAQASQLLKAQDYENARDNYKKYVELTGNDLYAQQRYASFLFLTKDYQQTVKVLESLDTTTNLSLRLLGMAYLELGEPQKSRAYMMRYFAQMKEAYTIPTDWLTRGKAQMAVGEEEGAMEDFEKAQEMDPAQVEIWKDIADEAYKNKQYERESRFRRLYIENKADASPRDYYFLGQAQYRAEQYEAADSTFGTVVSMQDNLTDAHYYRIRIAQKLDPENEHWLALRCTRRKDRQVPRK